MMGETSVERAYRIEQERDAACRMLRQIYTELQRTVCHYAPDSLTKEVSDLISNIKTIFDQNADVERWGR